MFKLESYITPIILSYVDKYVKNIKAEQSQLSLWGGDAVFSNLDLRLDVLEQELRLPFSFVSGHIHELQIHVPWTRLNAEPIVITINTIECVLKLPSENDADSETCSSSHDASVIQVGSSSKKPKKSKKQMEEAAPPGYIQSLINKIISNVSIVCNNLILKYVEEDIVLSLNTRNLRLTSANELWESAFTELSLPDLILRKLLKVTDMTVCLDKRNASGKIEMYQEPLLYRCSLSVHAAWCYDTLHSKIPSVSRYEVKCPKLDFSLTETQIPMFIRILKLVLALYYGEIAQKKRKKLDSALEVGDERSQPEEERHHESWSGWAWNVGSSVGTALLPIYWEDEDNDPDAPKLDEKRDRVFHIGMYIDLASLVLKLTEQQSDKSMFGNSKHCFSPFARVDCSGIFQELVVRGVGIINVSCGVSELLFTPVGSCLCGIVDTKLASCSDGELPLVQCGVVGGRQYLKGSLFEKDFGCESGAQAPKERRKSYHIEWDNHLEKLTEEKMLERSPAFAFDYLYYLEIPEEFTSEQLSELGYDLEYSNMSERALCRFVLGPSKVNICSSLLHRMEIIAHLSSLYDYAPYRIDVDLDSAHTFNASNKCEEIDSLMQGMPFRVYQFTAINPSILLYCADHPKFLPGQDRGSSPLSIKALPVEGLPGLILKMECLDGQFSVPMYPKRLVKAVVSLTDPPRSLLQTCHSHLTSKVINLSCHLFFGGQSSAVLLPSSFQIGFKQLMLPELWKDNGQIIHGYSFDLSSISIRITRPQVMVVSYIITSQFESNPKPNKLIDLNLLEDALTKKMSCFTINLETLRLQYDSTVMMRTLQLGIENATVHLSCFSKDSSNIIIPVVSRVYTTSLLQKSPMKSSPGRAHTYSQSGSKLDAPGQTLEPLLNIFLQIPISSANQVCTSLLVGHLAQMQSNMDPMVFQWFSYFPAIKSSSIPKAVMRETSVTSVDTKDALMVGSTTFLKSPSQSEMGFSKLKSPIVLVRGGTRPKSLPSAERLIQSTNYKVVKSSSQKGLISFISSWHPTFNSMLIQLRIEGHQVFFPKNSLCSFPERTVSEAIKKAQSHPEEFPMMGIAFPLITLENVAHKPMVQQFLNSSPFCIPEMVWNIRRDNLPWTLVLSDFSIFSIHRSSGKKVFMLDPVSTSCTLGLTVKAGMSCESSIAFCIHTDMSAIKATITESQLLLVIGVMEDFLSLLAKLYPQLLQKNKVTKMEGALTDQTVSSSEGSSTGASMARPNFDSFSDAVMSQQLSEVVASGPPLDNSLSLWLQWTVPQLSFIAITNEYEKLQFQLRLVMEDCQSSFDWTPIYFKMKCRVLAANVKCLMREQENQWADAGNMGIVLSCTDDVTREFHFINSKTNNIELLPHSKQCENDTSVFNFTFTRAECSSVHKKWQQSLRRKPASTIPIAEQECSKRFVSEIDVKLAPLDVIFSPEDMIPFVKMFSHILVMKIPLVLNAKTDGKKIDLTGIGFNNNTLPLVYVRAKTIRLFLISTQSTEYSHAALCPDFFLIQLDSFQMRPQVENPLARILVRPDLYHMATPLLSIPGSQIEDRQYQANFEGFGIYTGKWRDVLKKSEKPVKPLLRTMGENPALEWNTTKELPDQQSATEVLLMPCLSKFDLQIIIAPAITCDQSKKGKASQLLVAGHAIEINARNEVSIFLSLNQIKFCSEFTLELLENARLIHSSLKLAMTGSTDSGIDCEASIQSEQGDSSNESDVAKFVPIEVLVTGSKVTISVFKLIEGDRAATKKDRNMWRKYRYKHRRMEILEERNRTVTATEDSDVEISLSNHGLKNSAMTTHGNFDIGYDASEEGSVVDEYHETIKIYPLFHLHASQPHMFLTCSNEKQKFDISVFDASLNISPADYFITCGGKRLPGIMDYPTFWFQTKQGDLDPKSGIPPALFSCTISDFILRPWKINMTIERPLKFDLGLDVMKQFQDNLRLVKIASNIDGLVQIIMPEANSNVNAMETTASSQSVIPQMKKILARFSLLTFSSKQVLVHYPLNSKNPQSQMELIFGIMGIKVEVLLSSAIKKHTSRILETLEGRCFVDRLLIRMVMNGFSQNGIGPWSVSIKNRLMWVPYSDMPVTSVNIDSNILQLRIGPNTLVVLKALKDMTPPGANSSSTSCSIFPMNKCETIPVMEQNYVDDLRAGAFQYITEGKSIYPKPYQVVFSDKPASMTWKYPQPRTLTRVSIFPVPFMSASESGSSNDPEKEDGILCALQFWDTCLASFQTYSEFKLSEHQVCHLNLPTIGDIKRCAVSAIWRVLLHYCEDDAEFERLDRHIIVTPKSLVSVIRVDSYFSSTLIPKLQVAFNIAAITVDFINQLQFCGKQLIKDMSKFNLNQSFPLVQPIGTLKFDSLTVGVDTWLTESFQDVRFHLRLKTQTRIDLVDYCYMASHSLLYPSKIQCQVTYRRKGCDQSLDIGFHTKPILIRAGHFASHTLCVSSKLWQSVLTSSNLDLLTSCELPVELLTHFVICNDTPDPIRFGQADTEENNLLRPQECSMYAWRSQKARLLLRVCVEGGYWKWCDPFSLTLFPDKARVVRTIDHGTHKSTLLITCEKLSSVQRFIKISGLLSAANILKDDLEVRVILRPSQDPTNNDSLQEQRAVLASFSTTPSFIVDSERVQGVKIRLFGIGTPWSGEIPLKIDKGRKNSVLVRVPTKDKGQCLTVWCRLCEEIHGEVRRVLLIFSPMYMARSLLPNPMKILLSSQSTKGSDREMELPGRDLPVQLETFGASDQKYNVAFKVVDDLPPSDPINMSWGLIEQVRESVDEAALNIDTILKEIPDFGNTGLQTSWPFINDETCANVSVTSWELNNQPNTDVQVNFTQFHPLCNTLCIDINPWCLIVNQLGISLVIKETGVNGGMYCIANNSVLVPPQLQSTFYLGIQEGETEFFSPPLQLSDQEWHFRNLMPSVQGIIPMEGVAQTKIVLDSQICFLTISSRSEHGMRVIHIQPTFVLANRTGKNLLCSPMSAMKNKSGKFDLQKIDLVSMDISEKEQDAVTPLLLWQIIGDCTKDQLFDGFQHISLSFGDTEWSMPLNLEDCRSIFEDRRRKVFLERCNKSSDGFSNVAILLTIHQLNGQIHIVATKDKASGLVLVNNLDIPLRYGQHLKRDGISFGDGMFVNRKLQILAPGAKCCYTFPWLTSNFPFRGEINDHPTLALTSVLHHLEHHKADADWEIIDSANQWSNPVIVSMQHEEFLSLPSHGDIKVIVEKVADMTFVYIDPISKIEISAKDVRSRIPQPSQNSPPRSVSVLSTDGSEAMEASFVTIPNISDLSNKSFHTVTSPTNESKLRQIAYYSLQEESENDSRKEIEVFTSLYLQELSFVLSDDCFENENEKDEFLKLTFDSVLITCRPQTIYSQPLRTCGNHLPRFSDLRICVGNVQLDNQMYSRQPHEFAVILIGQNETLKLQVSSSCITEEHFEDLRRQSLVCIEFRFDSNTKEVFALKSIKVKSAPLSLNIEDRFLYKILEVFSSFALLPFSSSLEKKANSFQHKLPIAIDIASRSMASQVNLDEILIHPVDVSTSIHASIKMYVGLDQSPLNFSAFHRTNLLTNNYCLGQMLARHYISGALFRAGWVVGSLDLIGSPAGFTRTVGDGLKDFVALPYQGILHGPWAFVGGLTNGSTSLVKHISAGTLTSMTNFASSVSRNLDRLSLDQEYCQRNEIFRREKPRGIGQGLINGLSGVGISLLGAIGGIAHHPINAVLEQGMSPTGLVSGLTRGLLGVVTKPLGGAAEFVAQTGQGLLHGTGWSKRYQQRDPSMPDHVCTFVSSQLKYEWKLLNGSQLHNPNILFMAEVSKGHFAFTLLLTPNAVVIVSLDEDAQEAVYSLLEIDCIASDDDPTKLLFSLSNEPTETKQVSVKERVAQFVMDTGLHCTISDHESEKEENKLEEKNIVEVVEISKDFSFSASPVIRDAFVGMFLMARRQMLHKGFDIL